jgi:uncharacterized protein YjbI with pentapeptide repeats
MERTVPAGVRTSIGLMLGVALATLGLTTLPAAAAKVMVPSSPQGVSAYGGDKAVVVSWTPPTSDGGAPITKYRVRATADGHTLTCRTSGATSCDVVEAQNGPTYSVRVEAANSKGFGSPSNVVTAKPSAKPNCSYVGPYAALNGCNFSGADLSGVDLTGADLKYVNFTDTNLTAATLIRASLPFANFSDATLTGADISDTVENADGDPPAFIDANLTDVNFSDAFLFDGLFTNANLTGANLTGANLEVTQFGGATLTGADLTGADLSQVVSGGIVGTPAALPTNWLLLDGYLVGPSANDNGADFALADLAGADLAGAQFDQNNFSKANLTGANLTGADLQSATLTSAELTDADLDGANLVDATLTRSELQDANLTDADLLGASLKRAGLTGVVWSDTTCPDGTNSNNDGGTCSGT